MPHRFRDTQLFQQVDAVHASDAFGIVLSGSTNGVEIHRAMFLQALQCLGAHAPFADDRANTELLDNVCLIRFFAN